MVLQLQVCVGQPRLGDGRVAKTHNFINSTGGAIRKVLQFTVA